MSSLNHDGWDRGEMSFVEHLRELRNRLVVCLTTIGILALVLFWPAPWAIRSLVHCYFSGVELHAFGPTDVIGVEFRFAIYGALVLGLPVVLQQIWLFVVPAIHPQTRRRVYAYVAPALLLAAAGIAFCHFFILPRVVAALLAMTGDLATATFGIGPTVNLILMLFLAFALIFQTPVAMVALARIGIVNVAKLRAWRKFTLIGTMLVGGVAAPDGSPVTMLLLALPMYALYEGSILVIACLEPFWRNARSQTP